MSQNTGVMAVDQVVRHPYDGLGRRHQISFASQGRTRQEFADDANMRLMIQKYRAGQQPPQIHEGQSFFGSFENQGDFQESMNRVREAEELFLQLPARVRDAVGNSPDEFIGAISDPTRVKHLVELGLGVIPSPPLNPAGGVEPSTGPPAEPEGEGSTPPTPPPAEAK